MMPGSSRRTLFPPPLIRWPWGSFRRCFLRRERDSIAGQQLGFRVDRERNHEFCSVLTRELVPQIGRRLVFGGDDRAGIEGQSAVFLLELDQTTGNLLGGYLRQERRGDVRFDLAGPHR